MNPATVKKLNEAYNKVLAMPDIRAKITGPGNEIGGGTPEQFAALIAAENKRWGQVVKTAAIKIN
jgi:tripartite-type tricarboxylate transporter receptor subunit TctC